MKQKSIISIILIIVSTLLVGCANSPLTQGGNPDIYDRGQSMLPGRVIKGTVLQVRDVKISSSKTASNIGAIVGGIAGVALTKSRTKNNAALILAGLVGAASGSVASAFLGESKGSEIVVELPGNNIHVVIQEKGAVVPSIGQQVLLLINGDQVRIVSVVM